MVKYNFLEMDILLSFFRKEEISIKGALIKMQNPIIHIFFKNNRFSSRNTIITLIHFVQKPRNFNRMEL